MENGKEPKWHRDEAINYGKKSLQLLNTHGTELQPRLKTDEQEQHKANVDELDTSVSGQKQTLTAQKSNTQSQDAIIETLNSTIVSIRNIVKNGNATKEILVAYGVGDRIVHTVHGVTIAGNIIVDANKKYASWSKDAGILASDINEITTLIKSLDEAGKVQDDSMYVRKAKTMDKNTLQRTVEDEVSRLSSLGAHHFIKNPTVRKQFEDLIPPAHNSKPTTPPNNKKNENGESK